MENLEIKYNQIDTETFISLYKTTGWREISESQIEAALKNTLYSVLVLDHNKPIGMGRIIGDGSLYCYLQDLIVLPAYQGKGIGKIILTQLIAFLKIQAKGRLFIGLMAAENTIEFYQKNGFEKRPELGPGMFKILT